MIYIIDNEARINLPDIKDGDLIFFPKRENIKHHSFHKMMPNNSIERRMCQTN